MDTDEIEAVVEALEGTIVPCRPKEAPAPPGFGLISAGTLLEEDWLEVDYACRLWLGGGG